MTAPSPQSEATSRSTGRTASASSEQGSFVAGQGSVGAECRHERLTPPTGSGSPERRHGRGPGRLGLSDLLGRLSPRDIAVLDLIADHRFMTSAQVERFCFHDHATASSGSRTCRRVLGRLERWRLLERPIRRVGGLYAGSTSSIWMLTSVGQRLRNVRSGVGAVGRVRAPGERFIGHYLAIAEAHLALVEAERAGRLTVAHLAPEPACWRRYTGLGGSREVLKPDLFAVTTTAPAAEYEDHWFIEIDRATESLPTVLSQCRAYETYRRTGSEQADKGVFPLVLWVVPDDVRATKLGRAISTARGLDPDLYRVTTADRIISVICGEAT